MFFTVFMQLCDKSTKQEQNDNKKKHTTLLCHILYVYHKKMSINFCLRNNLFYNNLQVYRIGGLRGGAGGESHPPKRFLRFFHEEHLPFSLAVCLFLRYAFWKRLVGSG